MKNTLAKKLVTAADKYRAIERNYEGGAEIVQSDYDDLLSIAGMIEANEDKKKIGKAMWNLDTAVRDVIPDEVYNAYTL
jgi:hypothetical protein